MAPPEYARAITVDYKRPVGEVYRDAFIAHLNNFNNLALLAHCCLSGKKYEMSTWVQDWSAETTSVLYTLNGFFESGQSKAHARFIKPDILEVYETLCATVRRVATVCSQGESAAFDNVRSWDPDNLTNGSYISEQTMLDAYIGTLLMDRTYDYMKMSQLVSMQDARHSFLATFGNSDTPTDKDPVLKDSFVEVVLRRCRGRSFFETDEVYIGIAPAEALAGDRVCVILGCGLPVLLCPLKGERYQVIGLHYVHGLVNSEGLLGPIAQPWTVQACWTSDSRFYETFANSVTGEMQAEDPRLGPLPMSWRRLDEVDPVTNIPRASIFVDDATGDQTTLDPRLNPKWLQNQGHGLRKLQLV